MNYWLYLTFPRVTGILIQPRFCLLDMGAPQGKPRGSVQTQVFSKILLD